MRRPVTTRAQARRKFVAAEQAGDDVVRAAAGADQPKLELPKDAVYHATQIRSHARAALAVLNHSSDSA